MFITDNVDDGSLNVAYDRRGQAAFWLALWQNNNGVYE